MIYFISQSDEFVKIGYTGSTPGGAHKRLNTLQIGNPIKLNLMAYMDGDRDAEHRLHVKFDKYWVRGEWFRLSGEVLEYINNIPPYALQKMGRSVIDDQRFMEVYHRLMG